MATRQELLNALDELYDAECQDAFYLLEEFIKRHCPEPKVPYLQRKEENG